MSFLNRTTQSSKYQYHDIKLTMQFQSSTMKEYDLNWLTQLNAEIDQELSNPDFILEDLVKPLAISPAQLYRRVVKLTGKSPRQYIRHKRMLRAQELLERGVYPTVAEVAWAVGYRHVNYFSKVYEKEFGKRPSSYFK